MVRKLGILGLIAGISIATAGNAVGGPIQWSYTSSLGPEGGGAGILIGEYIRLDAVSPTGWSTADIVGHLQAASPSGPQIGSGHLTLGGYGPGFYMLQWQDALNPEIAGPVRERFQVQLTITDAASGRSGQVTAFGTGQVHQHDDMLANPTFGFEITEGASQSLTLGGNRYAVGFVASDDIGLTPGVGVAADVRVTAANTPEPGTLLLAGLGLASAAVGRRIRRRPAA